jgi:hypothetical protein
MLGDTSGHSSEGRRVPISNHDHDTPEALPWRALQAPHDTSHCSLGMTSLGKPPSYHHREHHCAWKRRKARARDARSRETGGLNTQHHVKLAAVRSGLYRELHRIIENFIKIVHTFYYDRAVTPDSSELCPPIHPGTLLGAGQFFRRHSEAGTPFVDRKLCGSGQHSQRKES